MEKLDLYKVHKSEYVAPRKPALINVGPAKYLVAEGRGEPGGEAFQARLQALYGVAFTIKMASKAAGRDYKVCGLEGMWYLEPGKESGALGEDAQWKLVIRVPEFVGPNELASAKEQLAAKGKGPEVQEVQLETIEEGRCVQVLHVGPYEQEHKSIEAMRGLAEAEELKPNGPHHEIYLSDPRRVPPERLRTILRQPVR
jgi:hypothetical protein